ncbi:TPA: hypothetical protein RQJ99_004565 [Vibrio vulnificus]|nr:hypothetical protein [Vibrio vulnificus]
MKPKSDTLFHFTKNLSFLKDILTNGFWPRYCLEDANWYSTKEGGYFVAYPMVCFCDIPLSRVDQHVNFYGNYGIGVTREWAEANDLSPVIYIRPNSKQHKAISSLLANNLNDKYYIGSSTDINVLMANIKPTEGNMYIGNDFVNKEFYQENEWRYTPVDSREKSSIPPWIYEEVFRNIESRELENKKSKENHSLKISPTDIKYLFVKSDTDIPELVNFIQSELDMYPSHDVKILLSRIVSLDTISRDL